MNVTVLSIPALEQRMLSAFLARTATADLIEAERRIAARAFTGPLDAVGFVDLTDKLRTEGLIDQINTPSFSPWSTRGRIFGIPHDIHPVMLAYRADIIEGAGIDMSKVETWDDFVRVLRPLMEDKNGDKEPDHYLLSFWESQFEQLEVIVLQAGGRFFDENGRPDIDSEVNARVLSTLVSWCYGPGRICADAPGVQRVGEPADPRGVRPRGTHAGLAVQRVEERDPAARGEESSSCRCRRGIRAASGRACAAGRCSASPATRGISRRCGGFASYLYLSRDLARQLYRVGDIVTPVKTLWDDPIFDEPDPYFSGQKKGRMYLELAPSVPIRTSSPYNRAAQLRMQDALVTLGQYARANKAWEVSELMPEARRLLEQAQESVQRELDRNVFLRESRERGS